MGAISGDGIKGMLGAGDFWVMPALGNQVSEGVC